MIDIHVVVAHYNEDLSWTKKLKYKYTIISKSGYPPETPPNKGCEASSYLQYIIENYDNLSEYTVFVHGHRSAWHHIGNIDEKINTLVPEHGYYNINDKHLFTKLSMFPNSINGVRGCLVNIEAILGKKITLENIQNRASAQFYVSRGVLRSIDKTIYKSLYTWLMTTNTSSYWTSRAFEYLWHVIFTGKHVDRF